MFNIVTKSGATTETLSQFLIVYKLLKRALGEEEANKHIVFTTVGLSRHIKINGITKGSHSFQQVFKAGFSKAIKYHYNISFKVLMKEIPYLIVSGLTTGLMTFNGVMGFINAEIIWLKESINKQLKKYQKLV